MWHEARKQERKIRGLIVDYRKRAERRQDFYERIQADPTQFIQIHGRRCKIHLDPAVAAAGDGAAIIVPWQGQQDNLIDRFDVRAHLDFIPAVVKNAEPDDIEIPPDERQCNYERYRILAQNDFLNVPEEKFLHQLYLEEQFGVNAQLEAERNQSKKKPHKAGATIGYSYDDQDSTMGPQPFSHLSKLPPVAEMAKKNEVSDSESDSDMDMDIDISISKLDTAQAHELNSCGRNYGMLSNDFYSFLTKDADEADALRIAREEEQEKMLLSGRKSRRERRAQKERRIASRPFSPPSYAAKEDAGVLQNEKDEESESRSPSPGDLNAGKITYITSFGGEDELQPHSKISINIAKTPQSLADMCGSGRTTYAQKVKENLDKLKKMNEIKVVSKHSDHDRNRRSRSRSYRRRAYRRSRSGSYDERSRRHRRSPRRRRFSSSSSSRSSGLRSSPSRHSVHKRKFIERSRSTRSRTSSTDGKSYTRSEKSKKNELSTESLIKPVPPPAMISYPLSKRIKGLINPSTTISTHQNPTVSHVMKDVPPMVQIVEQPPPPLKRYYGRKREATDSDLSSNASESEAADKDLLKVVQVDEATDSNTNMDIDTTSELSNPLLSSSVALGIQTGKYSTAQAKNPSYSNASETKASGSGMLNLRERLKRKMQNLLNKQYKADKRAEIEKSVRERQLQQDREDEMHELALKLRRRQRELRHKYGTPTSSKGSDSEISEPPKTDKSRSDNAISYERSTVDKDRKTVSVREEKKDQHIPNRSRSKSSQRVVQSRRKSRSRSRSRCSASKRRQRSQSRMRHKRDTSYERTSHYDAYERCRRSRSRNDRATYRDRDRQRERDAERNRGRIERLRDRDRYEDRYDADRDRYMRRDRERDRDKDRERQRLNRGLSRHSPDAPSNENRNRVVISAPPKLKKLVDY